MADDLASKVPTEALSIDMLRALLSSRAAIPADVARKARLHIADSLGIALAARSSPLAGSVVRGQLMAAGSGGSPVLQGGSASPLAAAFINASLIHILDYDDIHDEGRLHPSAVVLPAVLAVAGMKPLSDKALIEAVVLGNELMCRLGKVCAPQGEGPGAAWFLTQLFGYVAASVAASVALDLSFEQTVSAIGLAYMQAAGGKQAGFGTGANARAVYPAFAAQGGVQAALLAREGIIGPEGALDGAAGLFPIYLGGALSAAQRTALLDMSVWHFRDVELKPWPSCRLSHPYVAVALAAREHAARHPGAGILLAVNASAARLCRPLAQRRVPVTLQDAKYSIPFMTAYALVRGAPSLRTLDDKALSDDKVLAVAAKIELDEGLPDNAGHPQAVLTFVRDGAEERSYRFQASDLSMGEAEVRAKFEACLEYVSLERDSGALWRALMEGKLMDAIMSLARGQTPHGI